MDYLRQPIEWDIVEWYDELPLWSAPFGLMLLQYLPLAPNLAVLDVGCGTGFPLIELAQRLGASCTLTGIDLWEPALERVRRKAAALHVSNVELLVADAADMPFENGRFDLVVSNLGVNNFSDPLATLKQCHRVLKAGGHIALTTNLRGHMSQFYRVFDATLKEMDLDGAREALRRHIDHRAAVEDLRSLLVRAGFSVSRVDQGSFPMRFLDGSALLRHSFIRLAFLDAWRSVVGDDAQAEVFGRLEAGLNRAAGKNRGLELSIPMAYVEAKKS